MLLSLHVKNLALIDESEVFFKPGLNVLTGETGAGKSIIIGSMSLALGEKINRELLRDNSEDAFVELVFSVDNKQQEEKLKALDIFPEDGEVMMSRRMTQGRSIAKINGETVPAGRLRDAASVFIDIYGQKEHQILLNRKKHLEILDDYGKEQLKEIKEEVKRLYQEYSALKQELNTAQESDGNKDRELALLLHEVNEIESAQLKPGEDEEVEQSYRKLNNMQKIMVAVGNAYELIGGQEQSAGEMTGRACREIAHVSSFDAELAQIEESLNQADDLLSDLGRQLNNYLDKSEYENDRFLELEERLNLINTLKTKYGHSIEEIHRQMEEKSLRIQQLQDFDKYLSELKQKYENCREELVEAAKILSDKRQKIAGRLAEQVADALKDLNFLDVKFDMDFKRLGEPSSSGIDAPEFIISTNPGEPMKPLEKVASGGELSRIMLAMKSVIAENDEIGTLIFDEIDTGISGRTAQKVSEKMAVIAGTHQVISITHLPQIAAMADAHFLIEKSVACDTTISTVRALDEEGTVEEIARMLGGVEVTQTVLDNAREMRKLASLTKNTKSE